MTSSDLIKASATSLAGLLWLSACSSVPRIDGTSDAPFDNSHAQLVASLSPEDRLRLNLAEGIILSPRGCLTLEPAPGLPAVTATVGGQSVVKSCRRELHGMSFKDIMQLAYPKGAPGG